MNKSGVLPPLTIFEKVGYAIGDFGNNLLIQSVLQFLLYFYTDVFRIAPGFPQIIFITVIMWDILINPVMGYLADHTRTRWGRFRPYLLFGAVPAAITAILCFSTWEMSDTSKIVYAFATYMFYGLMISAIGNPYSALSAVMTQDQNERSVLASFRMTFAGGASMVVSISMMIIVNYFSNERTGFQAALFIFSTVFIGCMIITFLTTRERVEQSHEKYDFKHMFGFIRKNSMLIVLGITGIFQFAAFIIKQNSVIYYFKYNIGNITLIPIYNTFAMAPGILGIIFAPFIAKKFGKRNSMIIMSALGIVANLATFLIPLSVPLLIAVSALFYISCSSLGVLSWSMVADTVEFGEWKTGRRTDGIVYAFFAITQKIGIAVGLAIPGIVFSMTGYVANATQSPAASGGITILFTVIPAILSLISIGCILFYIIDTKLFGQILADIAARKKA